MKKSKIVKLAVAVSLLLVLTSAFVISRTSVFAASTIQLFMFNSSTSVTSNTISPHIKLVNTGSTALALSSVTIRYYYSEEGTQSQNFWYQSEPDVPQIYQYDLVPGNFYDIGISIHMGIRHLIHFAHQAAAAGYTGVNIARYALSGYNTGWVTNVSSGELTSYSDEIGALAGWYLNNNHLYDTIWTWTGDPRVDRSNPWGWYP